jgi:hydroxyacylglutathione hydrolase
MQVDPIKAFSDNYIWCLRGEHGGGFATVVDPGDARPVFDYLRQHRLRLAAILITHKHSDHTGGIRRLLEVYPGIAVYGPRNEPIAALTDKVAAGDRVELQPLAGFEVLDVPGHTEGHVAYFGEGALFCGDTLFAAGCGRVFSGTHAQLYASLQQIASLPAETLVYCAHEYTLDNLGFAQWVEPANAVIKERLERDRQRRRSGLPTVPSTLQEELRTNPFLRTHLPQVKAMAEKYAGKVLQDGEAVFTALRTWKDREYD